MGCCFLAHPPTLILPRNGTGFVDPATGGASLARVLCALDPASDVRDRLAFLGQWLPAMSDGVIEVAWLDDTAAGHESPLPPQSPRLHWQPAGRPATSVDTLVERARTHDSGLTILTAASPLGLRGRLRGSRVDRVLRETGLPVLTLPGAP